MAAGSALQGLDRHVRSHAGTPDGVTALKHVAPRPLAPGLVANRERVAARRRLFRTAVSPVALLGWFSRGRSGGSDGNKASSSPGNSTSGAQRVTGPLTASAAATPSVAPFNTQAETAAAATEQAVGEQQQWPDGPIVSCGGGGIYFFWMLGVMKYISSRYDLRSATLIGTSAGGLIAALTACEVDLDAAVQRAYQMAQEHKLWDRPLGLVGAWGPLVRQWLVDMLPDDAHITCSGGRVRLIATELPSLQQVYLTEFTTKDELVDACMASAHVPLVLDGRLVTWHRGKLYIDGSLQDFIAWDNSPLLKCDGRAFLLDYSKDDRLAAERFDFLKVRVIDEVLAMIKAGYKYARRLDAAGGLEPFLGGVRIAPLPNANGIVPRGGAAAARKLRSAQAAADSGAADVSS